MNIVKVLGLVKRYDTGRSAMNFMEKVKKMQPKEIAKCPEVRALWRKSLFWSLAHRRSYKYPLGTERVKDDFFDYKPSKEPVPLTEVETALLCWAGAGTSGLILNDVSLAQGPIHPSYEGRVYPPPINIWTHLLFSNDDGVFLYKPHVPTKMVEVETEDEMEVIFRAFKEGVTQLSDQPIRPTADSLASISLNLRQFFKPGTTAFLPIKDTSAHLLSHLLFTAASERPEDRRQVIDDDTGELAGIQKWVDDGYLKGATTVPLRQWELGMVCLSNAPASSIAQNIHLCATAMGLGGFAFGGGNPVVLLGGTPEMRGLGFRFARDKRGWPYPVGIDGVIEAHVPPYMSMDDAVEDLWNWRFGPSGCYNPEVKEGDGVIYTGFYSEPRAVHRSLSAPDKYNIAVKPWGPESIQITKDIANYIYNSYGRFPKDVDPIMCPLAMQVSHIDVEFYEKYWVKGSTWQEQHQHMRVWHKANQAGQWAHR